MYTSNRAVSTDTF